MDAKGVLTFGMAACLWGASAQAYLLTDGTDPNVHYEDFQGQPGTASGSTPTGNNVGGGSGATSPTLDPNWDYTLDTFSATQHITNPSNSDYLQTGGVTLSTPLNSIQFGALSYVNDGLLSRNSDDAAVGDNGGRIFSDNNHANYRIQADFPALRQVTEATSYSWHGGSRTMQRYTLYGSNAATAPLADGTVTDGAGLIAQGWTKIASVDTGVLDAELSGAGSYDEDSRHGADIGGALGTGSLGNYQHLLWDIFTPNASTWFNELDVYTSPVPEPATLGLCAMAGVLALRRRR
ncbi:MAG TPA: PEP-CTERM sorting domain-containing protein [Tepidisphaeraceae bacterium]|jgi:hypothetical protein